MVDCTVIFIFILKLFPHQLLKPCFCWYYLYLLWSQRPPSVHCTDIFWRELRKNPWMHFTMHVLMQRQIIPDSWIPLRTWLWISYRKNYSHSLCFCALMTQWFRNLAKNSRMFQSFLTMPRIMVQTIWTDTAS